MRYVETDGDECKLCSRLLAQIFTVYCNNPTTKTTTFRIITMNKAWNSKKASTQKSSKPDASTVFLCLVTLTVDLLTPK